MIPSPPRCHFFTHSVTSTFVRIFGIDFSWFGHQLLESVSPNVPSFFATYLGKNFLQNFIFISLSFFFGKPLATRILLGNSYDSRTCNFFQKLRLFMRSNSENYRNAGLFSDQFSLIFMQISKWISASICSSICYGNWLPK